MDIDIVDNMDKHYNPDPVAELDDVRNETSPVRERGIRYHSPLKRLFYTALAMLYLAGCSYTRIGMSSSGGKTRLSIKDRDGISSAAICDDKKAVLLGHYGSWKGEVDSWGIKGRYSGNSDGNPTKLEAEIEVDRDKLELDPDGIEVEVVDTQGNVTTKSLR